MVVKKGVAFLPAALLAHSCVRGADTPIAAVEETFKKLTDRTDIAILLINQHVRQ